MGILKSNFGSSRDEIWRQLSVELSGKVKEVGLLKDFFGTTSKVEVRHGEWTITLDSYTAGGGKSGTRYYTRMRAPYLNKDGFRFTIYEKSLFSGIGKFFGMQDVEVGFSQFDDAFIIKGNNEDKLKQLFRNSKIRELISCQSCIHFEVKDDEGWFGPGFPEGVDELYFQTPDTIKDIEQLKRLFDLFAEVLNHLCHINSAYECDPRLSL